jgi:hypothetical protein
MSQYARTLHSSLSSGIGHSWASSSSSSPYATSSSSAHANLLITGYINKYPPGLGHYGYHSSSHGTTDWRAPGSGYYPRRRAPVLRRPVPPVSPRTQPASTTSFMKFDPFSDDYSADPAPAPSPRLPASGSNPTSSYRSHSSSFSSGPTLYRTPRLGSTRPASLHTQTQAPYTIKLEPAPQPAARILDRDARSRLVAGILLNRVHAVGKPMRGGRCREPREYVKSGLSSVVSLEA